MQSMLDELIRNKNFVVFAYGNKSKQLSKPTVQFFMRFIIQQIAYLKFNQNC